MYKTLFACRYYHTLKMKRIQKKRKLKEKRSREQNIILMTKIKKGRYDTLVVVKKVPTFSSVISSFHYKSIGTIEKILSMF